MIQVKVSDTVSQFRKASLNYLGNISTLKVEVLGKICKLFSKRECQIGSTFLAVGKAYPFEKHIYLSQVISAIAIIACK